MTKFDRRKQRVLDALQAKTSLDVHEASELLDASPATTRRFFKQLADEGSVVRVHGGIRRVPESRGTYSYILSNTRRLDQKARIAARGIELIEPGDLLFLDSGTTILKMAEALAYRLTEQSITDIIVVTNSLVSYEKLCPCCKVILVGGEVRLSRRDTFGQIAETALSSLHVHKSFFGADAIHPDKGLMATDEWTCRMNDIIRRNSDSVYVLADSEKFGKSSLMTYCELDAVELIVTDNGMDEATLEPYRANGARIEVV